MLSLGCVVCNRRITLTIDRWSIKTGECPLGDADLHQAIGELYTQGWTLLLSIVKIGLGYPDTRPPEPNPYDAERHLVLGTSSAPEHLANLEYDWYTADEAHTAPFYISRAVLAYLLVGNLRDSARSMQIFLDRLVHDKSSIGIQDMKVGGVQAKIISSMPLMNFLNLLLLAVPRGRAESFRQLRKHYSGHLRDLGGWEEVIDADPCGYEECPVDIRFDPGSGPYRRNVLWHPYPETDESSLRYDGQLARWWWSRPSAAECTED